MEQINRVTLINDIFKILKKEGWHFEEIITVNNHRILFTTDEILDLPELLSYLKMAGITVENIDISNDDERLLHCDFTLD